MSTNAPVSHSAEEFSAAFNAYWQRFEDSVNASAEHSPDEKKQLLRQVFEGMLNPFTLSLLGPLMEQGKLSAPVEIDEMARELLARWSRTLKVHVTTAVPLPAAEEATLLALLKERYGKEILLEKIVDTGLIGGMVLRIGDKLFDGSVKSQLAALERDLLK